MHPLKRRIFAIIDFLTDFLYNLIYEKLWFCFNSLTGKLVILFSIFCYFFYPYTKYFFFCCVSVFGYGTEWHGTLDWHNSEWYDQSEDYQRRDDSIITRTLIWWNVQNWFSCKVQEWSTPRYTQLWCNFTFQFVKIVYP